MSRRITITAAALCAFAALLPSWAVAQTTDPWKLSDSWTFAAILYGYLPSIGGKTTFPGGEGTDIHINANDIIGNLNGAFMGSLEGQKGAWGAFTDILYMNVSGTKSQDRNFTLGGMDLPAGVNSDTKLTVKSTVWTLGGSYRVIAQPGATMDLLAGARLLDASETLNFQLSGNLDSIPLPGQSTSRSVSENYWDGIVGVKGRFGFGDENRWVVPYYADVGTGQSKSTWQLMGGLGYAYNWGSIFAAWRYMDWNFKSGSKIESLNLNGPMLGVAFRW